MPAKDIYHTQVKNALLKDGWNVTDDPLKLELEGKRVEIDLGAEKIILASKKNEKIAIEIKSFLGESLISDFHNASGQYTNYRLLLKRNDPERKLYMALSDRSYDKISKDPLVWFLIKGHRVKMIIVDVEKEEIVQWKK